MVKMKIEISGMINGKEPRINQVTEVDAVKNEEVGSVLKSMLHVFRCQGFVFHVDIINDVVSSLSKVRASGKYQKVAEVNEHLASLKVYCKKV